VKQPSGNGTILFQYGHYSDLQIQPVSAEAGPAGAADEGGVPPLVWIAVIGAVVVIAAIAFTRRRRSEEETG
jgi:hypothetical protein